MQLLQLLHIPKRKPHPQVPARKPIESSPSNLYGMLHPYNRPLSHPTGQLGEMPSPSSLPQSLRLLPASQASNTSESVHSANLTQLLSNLTETYGASSKLPATPSPQFVVGHSLPPISKKLADRILAGKFVDLADLPPAKGKVRPLCTPDGSVLLVHAHDFMQQKRLIPDLATWTQCFSLYTAVVCSKNSERLTDLLGYMCQITKASQPFMWPSWVTYDQNFRQEAAERDMKEWA